MTPDFFTALSRSDKTDDFDLTSSVQGATTATPPVSGAPKSFSRDEIRKMSPDEINKNWDAIKSSLNSI